MVPALQSEWSFVFYILYRDYLMGKVLWGLTYNQMFQIISKFNKLLALM